MELKRQFPNLPEVKAKLEFLLIKCLTALAMISAVAVFKQKASRLRLQASSERKATQLIWILSTIYLFLLARHICQSNIILVVINRHHVRSHGFFFPNKVDSGQTLVSQAQARDILSRESVRKWDRHLITGHVPPQSSHPILTLWYACISFLMS